jgi:hypothetical protein
VALVTAVVREFSIGRGVDPNGKWAYFFLPFKEMRDLLDILRYEDPVYMTSIPKRE